MSLILLTDPEIVKAGLVDELKTVLGDYFVGVFYGVVEDSGSDVINQAATKVQEVQANLIISLGEGSSIDAAKCVTVAVKNTVTVEKVISYARLAEHQTQHFAITTTVGTGSDLTFVAVIRIRL